MILDYRKFINDTARDIFLETYYWDARNWRDFRKMFYDDYFGLRDSLTIKLMKKEDNSEKEMNIFKLNKLYNIRKYNKKLEIPVKTL